MKKIFIIFACVMLGIMTSGCIFDIPYIEDTSRWCEHKNDSFYLSWVTTPDGEELSTSIPYISESESNLKCEVVKTDTNSVFVETYCEHYMTGYSLQTNIMVLNYEYRFDVVFNNFTVSYLFDYVDHYFLNGDKFCDIFEALKPEFELIKCEISPLADETEDGKQYTCSELSLLLKVTQGEKVLEVPKTVKIMQLIK